MEDDSAESYQSAEQCGVLRQRIAVSLQQARTQKRKLKNADRQLSIASLILGTIATFVAGLSAIAGDPIVGNWRFTAVIASVFTLGATVTAGIHKQIVPTDLIVECSECVAQLKVLAIETIPDVYDIEAVRNNYQHLIAQFSNIDC